MTKVTDSIGKRFEDFLTQFIPEMESIDRGGDGPDFYHPEGFFIEAKVGNEMWGPRIKERQIEYIKHMSLPLIYSLGYHNLDDAHKRVKQKTKSGRQRYLERNMDIKEIYFISGRIMELLWEKESRINREGTIMYCCVKKSMLRNKIRNRPFQRGGVKFISSEEFYGYDRDEFFMMEALQNGEKTSLGMILHKETEDDVIQIARRFK